ncbi:hypothetical protein LOK49_LG07G02432 [Camellia lanceoleosa]|uniref:Uncharacterized protein n=1 Tax=Camellia lanceoleosa TaxID=1840588 RepID=A0ACC0H4T0_9ERIC|nr:hypothetical protein LOK49_LG07G02432 [Camellia lanceoleosa]
MFLPTWLVSATFVLKRRFKKHPLSDNAHWFASVIHGVNNCMCYGGCDLLKGALNYPEYCEGEAVKLSSQWTRSCECKQKYVDGASTSKNVGGKLQGHNLFVQSKIVAHSGGAVRRPKQRLNFLSNIASVVKMVYAIKLKDMHLIHLRKTPFWLLFEAILVNLGQLVATNYEMLILRGDIMVAEDRVHLSGSEGGCDGCHKNEMEVCKVQGDAEKKVADSSNASSEDGGGPFVTPTMCVQGTPLRPNVLCVREQLGPRIDAAKIVGRVGSRLIGCDRVDLDINDFGVHNIDKDEVIAKLEEEVLRLKTKNEMQAIHIIEGFESVLRVKDEEKKKLELKNVERRQTITILEEQLADQAVHNGGVARMRGYGNEAHGEQRRSTSAYADIIVDASPVSSVSASSHYVNGGVAADVVQYAELEVVVTSLLRVEGGRAWKVNSDVCVLPSKVPSNGVGDVRCETVVNVDTAPGNDSKFYSFGINNQHTVWKMMTKHEKDIISSAYDRDSDGAVMWVGRGDGNAIYFSDVKAIIRLVNSDVECVA